MPSAWIIQKPLGTRLFRSIGYQNFCIRVQKHVFRTYMYPQKMEVAVHGAVTKKHAVT